MSGVDVTSWPSGAIDVESPELGISCSELGVGSSVRPKSRTDFAFQHLSTGVAPFYTNLLATPGTGACQFDDLRRLGFDELVLDRPEESLRIIEGQSDVAVCRGAAVPPDDQDTMLPRLGARVGELECHKHAHGAPPV